jgi:hypothetical protein
MFSLDLPTEPYWLALPHGVRIKVRPLSATVLEAARAAAIRRVAAIEAERQQRLNSNLDAGDLPDLADDDLRVGLISSFLAEGLARYGILAWEGIAEAHTPAMAERLMRHAEMTSSFLLQYQAPLRRLDAEGNALPPAPRGSLARAATTAGDASGSAPIAPVS